MKKKKKKYIVIFFSTALERIGSTSDELNEQERELTALTNHNGKEISSETAANLLYDSTQMFINF